MVNIKNVNSTESIQPLKYEKYYATVKVRAAEIRTGPGSEYPLIGYLPGAERVQLEHNEKNGWTEIYINWNDKRKSWIKKNDIVNFKDYQFFTGNWPLEFILFSDGHGSSWVWMFPTNNKCNNKDSKKEYSNVVRKTGIIKKNVKCQELWEAKNSKLIYANPDSNDIDIWFERKNKEIFVNSIIGDEIGAYIYGYRDGTSKVVWKECKKGKSIACKIYEEVKPYKKPFMKNPKLTYNKHEFSKK